MKLPKLDLWIAVDRKFFIENGRKKIKNISFIFHKKPKKYKDIDEDIKVMFDFENEEEPIGSYSRIFSAKSLGLENDTRARKLYVLKKRHKKSTRTFWLAVVGYKKYVLTGMFPIKMNNIFTSNGIHIYEKIRIQADDKIFTLYGINLHDCEISTFNIKELRCMQCPKFIYCHNLYLKHSISYEKIYLYFIKDNKKVYL